MCTKIASPWELSSDQIYYISGGARSEQNRSELTATNVSTTKLKDPNTALGREESVGTGNLCPTGTTISFLLASKPDAIAFKCRDAHPEPYYSIVNSTDFGITMDAAHYPEPIG